MHTLIVKYFYKIYLTLFILSSNVQLYNTKIDKYHSCKNITIFYYANLNFKHKKANIFNG